MIVQSLTYFKVQMLLNVFILIVNEIVPVPVSTVSSFNAVSY